MLHETQIRTFLTALAFESSLGSSVDPDDAPISADSVVGTRDTLDHFRAGGGVEKIEETPHGALHIFCGCQPNGKGSCRGTLYVMDFGDIRAASFCA